MCGILGIIGHRDIAGTLLEGLTSIQHRGQDAAGIVTFNHRFHLHKADGLVGQAFKNLDLEKFQGRCGLGHVRYATQGSTDVLDAQSDALLAQTNHHRALADYNIALTRYNLATGDLLSFRDPHVGSSKK